MDAALSVRVDLPGGGRFGPGKAALLTAIDAEGSVAAAARSLEMSYPRALRLVEDLNALFGAPLIETFHGGAKRGGARLTQTGAAMLATYGALCEKAEAATRPERKTILDAAKPA
ncbi:MAG: LysR family transcriptional regulator [Pseudomonadota bacterium]